MKDWFTVQPDVVKLLNKHFTPGRGGRKIKYITRHHLAGIGTTEDVWNWWQTRAASAHYVVENSGRIGQLVWDRDTAWSNANAISNAESITIEHSNSAGAAADWPINDTVIREGAKLAAALCWFYKLGRPKFGVNIRDHREFASTSCPHHLANGNKYHAEWMRIAGEHYDWMVANDPKKKPAGSSSSGSSSAGSSIIEKGKITVAEADRIINEIKNWIDVRLTGPVGSDVKDVRQQLTGGRNAGEYPGWKQLGQNNKGANLTLVDAVAALRHQVQNLQDTVDEIKGGK